MQSSGIVDFETLIEALIKEQFLQSLSRNVRAFVASKEPKTAHEPAKRQNLQTWDHIVTLRCHAPFLL